MAVPVHLHLYDLTQGMASALSPILLGKQLAGIWHTGEHAVAAILTSAKSERAGCCKQQRVQCAAKLKASCTEHASEAETSEPWCQFIQATDPCISMQRCGSFSRQHAYARIM